MSMGFLKFFQKFFPLGDSPKNCTVKRFFVEWRAQGGQKREKNFSPRRKLPPALVNFKRDTLGARLLVERGQPAQHGVLLVN